MHRVLAAVALVGMTACGSAEPAPAAQPATTPTVADTTTTEALEPTTTTVEAPTTVPATTSTMEPTTTSTVVTATSSTSPPPVTPTDGITTVSVHPVTPGPVVPMAPDIDAAIRDTLAGMSDLLVSVVAGGDAPYPSPTGASWLTARIRPADDTSSPCARNIGNWEAQLVSGAVAERIAADGDLAHWITGIVIDVLLPDGSVEPWTMAPQGHVAARQAYPPPQSDGEIEAEIGEILARRGLTPVEVKVLHPLGPAPRVIASAPLDVLAGQVNDLLADLSGDPERYEGLYLELRTPDGVALMCTGSSRRLFGGMLWIDPDVEELLGGPPHSTIPLPPPTS